MGRRAAEALARSAAEVPPVSHLFANAVTSFVRLYHLLWLLPSSVSSASHLHLAIAALTPFCRPPEHFRQLCPHKEGDPTADERNCAKVACVRRGRREGGARWPTTPVTPEISLGEAVLLIALCPRVGGGDTITASSRSYLSCLLILFLRVISLS